MKQTNFFDFLLDMDTVQLIFLGLCIVCLTFIICFFLRIFWGDGKGTNDLMPTNL